MEENLLRLFVNDIESATQGWRGHASSNPCALLARDEATREAANSRARSKKVSDGFVVGIIGAGPAGVCMAIKLKQAGIDCIIFEQ